MARLSRNPWEIGGVILLAGPFLWVVLWMMTTREGDGRLIVDRRASTESEPDRRGWTKNSPSAAEPRSVVSGKGGIAVKRTDETAPVLLQEPDPQQAVALTLRLVDPRGNRVLAGKMSLRVSGADGLWRTAIMKVPDGEGTLVVAAELLTIRADVEGYRHRDQVVDLRGCVDARESSHAANRDEDLVLWPEEFVPVTVRTPAGDSFVSLAARLGIAPKRLLVGAFDAVVRSEPFDEAAHWDSRVGDLAGRFRPPPKYQTWELPGAAVGSIELYEPGPVHVALQLFGAPMGSLRLLPEDLEASFVMDEPELRASLARVFLRVVDSGGIAAEGARVTLRSDTSAHRRRDQNEKPVLGDGRVTFDLVVPGRYELSVMRGNSLHQSRITLVAGEVLDKGDVVLADGDAISIKVVDDQGDPIRAWVEIGPYKQGGELEQIFPPMLHRQTGPDGAFELPAPSVRSAVRVRAVGEFGGYDPDLRSAISIVEPGLPRQQPLLLVVSTRVPVTVETTLPEAATIEWVDDAGLVIERLDFGSDQTASGSLVIGSYRAILRHRLGAVVCQRDVDVRGADPMRIRLP